MQRDKEMDSLQNSLQKNRVRLEAMTTVMLDELRAFKISQAKDFKLVLNKFNDIHTEFFYKVKRTNKQDRLSI